MDAEFALESIFLERYALFLKVYTHPAKVAAGAMLGKALAQAAGKKPIDERTLEWLGDGTLLDRLSESRQQDTKKLAKRLVCRDLFKQAFRATVLGPNELKQDVYVARLEQFKQKKLFGPQNRAAAERRLAEESRLKPSEVIIYCVDRVPGEKKLQHYVEHSPDDVRRIDEIQNPYFRALQRHLSLWIIYVFTSRDEGTPEFARLGEAAAKLFGLDNQLSSKPRQRLLF